MAPGLRQPGVEVVAPWLRQPGVVVVVLWLRQRGVVVVVLWLRQRGVEVVAPWLRQRGVVVVAPWPHVVASVDDRLDFRGAHAGGSEGFAGLCSLVRPDLQNFDGRPAGMHLRACLLHRLWDVEADVGHRIGPGAPRRRQRISHAVLVAGEGPLFGDLDDAVLAGDFVCASELDRFLGWLGARRHGQLLGDLQVGVRPRPLL